MLYLSFFFQEKWDSMTRKWKDNCLLQLVRLFLIDEVNVFVRYFVHRPIFHCSKNPIICIIFNSRCALMPEDKLSTICLIRPHWVMAHH